MSYIYAHKTENSIKILSDTKVTINSNDLSRLKKRFSEKEYNNFLKYGFIKTVIYKPNITISSAGEVEHFNELLSFLYQNNINDITVIQNKALEINVHYNRDTDFIITTEKEIFKVAEKKIQNVSSCWIGDEDANNEFAKFKEKVILPDIYYPEIVSESTKKIEKEAALIDAAFSSLIDNPQINTVGGFVVRCIYENNTYKFLGNFIVSSSKSQVLNKNDVINFDSSRAEGGFSFISKESCDYYCGCFKQINKCIIYKEGYSDNSYKYISMPYIIDNNENL